MILPKILYYFTALSIPVPAAHLQSLQVDILHFIWNYKKHRTPHLVLFASKNTGGLAFPNHLRYYHTSQLKAIAS